MFRPPLLDQIEARSVMFASTRFDRACKLNIKARVDKAMHRYCWAEAPVKIARMTLTIKLDGNWNSFQLANNTPPLSVTGSVIAPSARMNARARGRVQPNLKECGACLCGIAFSSSARQAPWIKLCSGSVLIQI